MGMEVSERRLYELEEYWKHFRLTPALAEKIRLLRQIVPKGTHRILDVGCGNGLIANALAEDLTVVGLDWSYQALRHVLVPKICASAAALPIRPGVFDLILCSELLEHLPGEDLQATVGQLQRLRPAHLLITVPNQEHLRVNALRCPRCRAEFNASHHQHSFTPESLSALFPAYQRIDTRRAGPPVRAYRPALLWLRQRLGHRWYQIPAGRQVMCPSCGNTEFPAPTYNPISFLCDGLNRLISRRRPYWLLLLLQRR
jgi:SAM-dependent methyltransferase